MVQQQPTIDLLLNLVPDRPDTVLSQLQTHPDLASQQDENGYSLLHAAVSYNHTGLALRLVNDFHVNPNLLDVDHETCLFNAETVDMARLAVQELGVDTQLRNTDGQIAAEKLDDDDEWPLVAAFLRDHSESSVAATSGTASSSGNGEANGQTNGISTATDDLQPLPPMPPGVQINLGTMSVAEAGDAPDPELRRRIEELAAREDFTSEATQQELRDLISDALSSVRAEQEPGMEAPPTTRRRME